MRTPSTSTRLAVALCAGGLWVAAAPAEEFIVNFDAVANSGHDYTCGAHVTLPAGDWQVVVRDSPDPHFDAYSPWASDSNNGGYTWRWGLCVNVPDVNWATDGYWWPNGGDVVYYHTAQEALAANLGQPPLFLPHLDSPATVWFWCGDWMNWDNRGGASVAVVPEPATLPLLGAGVVAFVRRRHSSR